MVTDKNEASSEASQNILQMLQEKYPSENPILPAIGCLKDEVQIREFIELYIKAVRAQPIFENDSTKATNLALDEITACIIFFCDNTTFEPWKAALSSQYNPSPRG